MTGQRGPSHPSTPWPWIIRTSVACLLPGGLASGQEIIALPDEDRWLQPGFEELYRVGSLNGDDWDTFGGVSAVAFDGAGNVHILDGQAAQITVVDLQGNLVRQFGRVGEGPGEFSGGGTWALTVCSDGRIAVYDAGRRTFVLFGPTGEFERTMPLDGPRLISIPGVQADHGSPSVVSTGEVQYLDWTPLPRPPFRYVMRYGLEGEDIVADTVTAGWKPPGGYMVTFAPVFSVGVLPGGGLAFTDSSAYAIKVAGPDGSLSRVITRPFHPVPVTERHKTEYVERLRKETEGGSEASADFWRARIESMEFHHEIPVVRALRTSREGTIWVRRRGDAPDSDGPIDLITPEGRYLGSFAADATRLPSAFGPGGLVAFVETNELDVPTVVVKRLPTEAR